ncbi:MAG: hypothetical protein JXR68_00085 [Bacteroidales bacterium]|nr:hypothetical protein [Bacteroidales bacterium]
MKKITLILSFLLVAIIGFAQTPNQFKYQAVIRNASGDILANQSVAVQIDIIQTELTGTIIFTEIHNATTSANGVVSLNVGSVEDMSAIDWNADDYFIKVTVNGTEMGTSQLLSVPFALQAQNAVNATNADNAITADYATAAGVFTDMAIVTGTTGSGSSVSFAFPAGYDQTNCLVAACGIEAQVGSALSWRSIGTTVSGIEGSIYVSLSTTNIWLYYPNDVNYQSKNFKIILMKLD